MVEVARLRSAMARPTAKELGTTEFKYVAPRTAMSQLHVPLNQ